MSRKRISFNSQSPRGPGKKAEAEGGCRSNGEAVNDVIRKARETEFIRARLIEAEQSGFTRLSHQQIRAEIRDGIRAADNGEFASDAEMNRILGKHGSD